MEEMVSLTSREVAKLLGVCEMTLTRMRRDGRGPSFYRLSPSCVRYRKSEVEQWLAQMEDRERRREGAA